MGLFNKNRIVKKTKTRDGIQLEIVSEEYDGLFSKELNDNVSVELLDEILNNKSLYNYCLYILGNKNENLKFLRYRKNIYDTVSYFHYSKLTLIDAFKKNKDRYKNKRVLYNRFKQIISTSEYDFYEDNVKDSLIKVGDKGIKVSNIIKILSSAMDRDSFINELNSMHINIDELLECLSASPINLLTIKKDPTEKASASILEGYNFPNNIKAKILKNVEYIKYNSYLFNKVPNSNLYLFDIVDFINNNNMDEYVKNNDNILGLSFVEVAKLLNEFIFKIDYTKTNVSTHDKYINLWKKVIDKELNNKLSKFVDLYIPDPLSEMEFLPANKFRDVQINDELRNKIFSEIPENYTDLQKVYFIYKYLCNNFVYDSIVLAGSQMDEYDINNHRNIDNIKDRDFNNNDVVCWDVSLILAKFIEELGFPTQLVDYDGEIITGYGKTHTAVKTKVGDYLLNLDITNGLIHNDMSIQQLSGQVMFFKILNNTNRVYNKAKKEIEMVDKYFNSKYGKYQRYVSSLEEYTKMCDKDLVSFDDKVGIIVSCLLNEDIDDTSKILATNKLKEVLFKDRGDNFFIGFVGSKEKDKTENAISLGCILVCNENGISNVDNNKYYFFPNLKGYVQLTKQEIEALIRERRVVGIKQLEIEIEGVDEELYYEGEEKNEKGNPGRNK